MDINKWYVVKHRSDDNDQHLIQLVPSKPRSTKKCDVVELTDSGVIHIIACGIPYAPDMVVLGDYVCVSAVDLVYKCKYLCRHMRPVLRSNKGR